MQQSLAGNLSNVVIRNHAKVDKTSTSKDYNVQNYAAVQDSRTLLQNKHTRKRC